MSFHAFLKNNRSHANCSQGSRKISKRRTRNHPQPDLCDFLFCNTFHTKTFKDSRCLNFHSKIDTTSDLETTHQKKECWPVVPKTLFEVGSRNKTNIYNNPSLDPRVSFLVLTSAPGSSMPKWRKQACQMTSLRTKPDNM